MNIRACIAIGLLAAAVRVCADEKLPTLKIGSEVYSNVVVINKTATDIYFTHARGMGNVKLKALDPELQKRFGFDAAKADEVEKKQFAANVAYRKEITGAKPAPPPAAQSGPGAVGAGDIVVPEIHARSFRGSPPPRLVVEKWLGEKPDTRGKFVLVDFWATWCGPCRRAIPELNDFHARFKDRLVIIGLSDEPEEVVRKMVSPKMDYFVAIDTSASMRNAAEVQGIPHAILVDPKGIVRFEGHPGFLTAENVAGLLAKYSN